MHVSSRTHFFQLYRWSQNPAHGVRLKRCPFVEVTPGKVSGLPLIKGTRVQAETIPAAELGEAPEEIAYNYDLKLDDIRASWRMPQNPR